MRSIGVSEAKARLSELLRAAERGETIVILRHGRPVARLTPPAPWPEGVGEAAAPALDLASLERDGVLRRPRRAPDGRLLDTAELAVPAAEGLLDRMLLDVDEDRSEDTRQ